MGIHLITGHAGTAHVTSDDQRHINSVLHGSGSFIIQGCELTMSGANTAHIAEGLIYVNGAFVRVINGGQDVSVQSGSVGETRTDTIVVRIETTSSGIESASLVCKKNASASGGDLLGGATTAEFDMYALPITGVNVGTPQQMMPSFTAVLALGLGSLASKNSLTAGDIPSLAASKVTSGTFDAARIPSLDAGKITSGTLNAARIPTLALSKLSGATNAAAASKWVHSTGTSNSWNYIKFTDNTCICWKRMTGQKTGTRSWWNGSSWLRYGATPLTVGSYPFTIGSPTELVSIAGANQDGVFLTCKTLNSTTTGGTYYTASISAADSATASLDYNAHVVVLGTWS